MKNFIQDYIREILIHDLANQKMVYKSKINQKIPSSLNKNTICCIF